MFDEIDRMLNCGIFPTSHCAGNIFTHLFLSFALPPLTPPPLISFDTSAPRGTLGVRRTIKELGPAPTTFDEVIFICIHKVLILTIRYWQSSNFINTSNKHFFSTAKYLPTQTQWTQKSFCRSRSSSRGVNLSVKTFLL